MAQSFFFYDVETSGFDARAARVMQFAGQRTDMELRPIGEPVNYLIKLTPDVLPSPDAILVTGITPQQTIAEGLTEAEFLKLFHEVVARPDTIFVGFNSVRFDDEFMRFLLYRNFYDPYEWHWKDGCSRWDLLDVTRMTRALRPDGIEWPFAPDGKPANRLELLAKVNHLDHSQAHDALSDVQATIDLARLLRKKQPDLFEYSLTMRDKKKAEALVTSGKPFIYTSGRYAGQYLHTSATVLLARHPQAGAALVYDLRVDPTAFLSMTVGQLAEVWKFTREPDAPPRLPVKTLRYNRCPAIAPMGVTKAAATQTRLDLDLVAVARHRKILGQHPEFADKILAVVAQLDAQRTKEQASLVDDQLTVDSRLYEKFINDADKTVLPKVRIAPPESLNVLSDSLTDDRLKSLLPLYKARNYPHSLTSEEQATWDEHCHRQLVKGGSESQMAKYFKRLSELGAGTLTAEQRYILEELQLYGQAIAPLDEAAGEAG